MKKLVLLMAALSISACATTTPLPDVKGSVVRPLNPTKWDYQAAVLEKQKEIGVTPRIADTREGEDA